MGISIFEKIIKKTSHQFQRYTLSISKIPIIDFQSDGNGTFIYKIEGEVEGSRLRFSFKASLNFNQKDRFKVVKEERCF